MLGVGTGGVTHGTEAWEAVGVPYAERGHPHRRGARAPAGLIRGETVELPSGSLIDGRRIPPEDAANVPITGTSAQAAERFVAYADAGAT